MDRKPFTAPDPHLPPSNSWWVGLPSERNAAIGGVDMQSVAECQRFPLHLYAKVQSGNCATNASLSCRPSGIARTTPVSRSVTSSVPRCSTPSPASPIARVT